MKHLATIQVEFLKEAAKWEDLSYDAQKKYLQEHRKSKKKMTAKPGQGGADISDLKDEISKKRESLTSDTNYGLPKNLSLVADSINGAIHSDVTDDIDSLLDGTKWEDSDLSNLTKEGFSAEAINYGRDVVNGLINKEPTTHYLYDEKMSKTDINTIKQNRKQIESAINKQFNDELKNSISTDSATGTSDVDFSDIQQESQYFDKPRGKGKEIPESQVKSKYPSLYSKIIKNLDPRSKPETMRFRESVDEFSGKDIIQATYKDDNGYITEEYSKPTK